MTILLTFFFCVAMLFPVSIAVSFISNRIRLSRQFKQDTKEIKLDIPSNVKPGWLLFDNQPNVLSPEQLVRARVEKKNLPKA